jgi:outer membrane protein
MDPLNEGGKMRRYNLIIISAMTVLLTTASYGMAADVAKIGIIDGQRVLETSDAGKAARGEIKGAYNRMEEELKKRGAEFEELKKQFERNAMVMSQEKREQSQRDLQIKQMDLQQLGKKYSTELKAIEKKYTERIQKDVLKLTEEMGKSGGYLLIIDKPGVLYHPNSIELTDQLIQKYNAKYAKGDAEASKKD